MISPIRLELVSPRAHFPPISLPAASFWTRQSIPTIPRSEIELWEMSERISSEKNFTVKIAKGWRAGMDPIERERESDRNAAYIYIYFIPERAAGSI